MFKIAAARQLLIHRGVLERHSEPWEVDALVPLSNTILQTLSEDSDITGIVATFSYKRPASVKPHIVFKQMKSDVWPIQGVKVWSSRLFAHPQLFARVSLGSSILQERFFFPTLFSDFFCHINHGLCLLSMGNKCVWKPGLGLLSMSSTLSDRKHSGHISIRMDLIFLSSDNIIFVIMIIVIATPL